MSEVLWLVAAGSFFSLVWVQCLFRVADSWDLFFLVKAGVVVGGLVLLGWANHLVGATLEEQARATTCIGYTVWGLMLLAECLNRRDHLIAVAALPPRYRH